MYVPAGRTVQLVLTSQDVIHAFYVPQFLFKRDVVPGRVNKFDFKVDAADAGQTFRGQCAELCGTGHRIMLFEVHALSAGRLRRLAGRRGSPRPAPTPAPPTRPAAGRRRDRRSRSSALERRRTSRPTLDAPGRAPRSTIEFDNKDAGVAPQRRDPQGLADRRGGLQGRDLPRPGQEDYDVPALDGRDLRLRLHRPSEHDRHADGPVRSPDGDDHPDAGRLRLPERACTPG